MVKRTKTKRVLTTIIIIAIAIFIVFNAGVRILNVNTDTFWKAFLPYIDTYHFFKLLEKNNNFIGMSCDDLLDLLTKDDIYILFDESFVYQGLSYNEWIQQYPQLTLNGSSRKLLYCIPVQNSGSREEAFLKGFFVDCNGVVSEGPVNDIPFGF